MPKPIAYQQLPDEVKLMDPDERESYLMNHGYYIVPDMGMKVPGAQTILKDRAGVVDTPHTEDVMGFGPGLTHPENSKAMMRGGATVASTLAGGASLPVALGFGALNVATGPDPFSGRGVAENVANAAFGRLAPVMQMGKLGALGPKLTALKNAAIGAGQVGATQALGNALTADPMPLSPGTMVLGGAASALLPAAAGRFLQAVQKSTPMVRAKMQPIIDRLTKEADAPVPSPTQPELPVIPQVAAKSPTVPAVSTVAPKEAARSLKAEKLASMLQQHGISPDDAALMQDEQWSMLAKAAGVNPPSKDTVQATMGLLRGQTAASKPVTPSAAQPSNQSVSAQPSQNDDLEELMRKSLIAKGVPAEKLPPVSASIAPPATAAAAEPALPSASPSPLSAPKTIYDTIDERIGDLTTERMDKYKRGMQGTNIRENTDAMAVVGEMRRSGSRKFIDDMVASKDWSDVPRKIEYLDMAFPEGEHRSAIQEKILEKVLGGIGSSGEPFGDLTPIERIVSFGKQKFGSKTGTDIINKIFDGSPEAYRNIRDLQKIIEVSGINPDPTQSRLRLFLNNMRPVIGGSLGTGTALALTAYVPVMGPAGAAAGAYTGMKAISIGMDTLADYIGKKGTKWADVLYDMATGGNRYSAQSVSNVISGLRRRAEDERDLNRDQALAEMAQYQ